MILFVVLICEVYSTFCPFHGNVVYPELIINITSQGTYRGCFFGTNTCDLYYFITCLMRGTDSIYSYNLSVLSGTYLIEDTIKIYNDGFGPNLCVEPDDQPGQGLISSTVRTLCVLLTFNDSGTDAIIQAKSTSIGILFDVVGGILTAVGLKFKYLTGVVLFNVITSGTLELTNCYIISDVLINTNVITGGGCVNFTNTFFSNLTLQGDVNLIKLFDSFYVNNSLFLNISQKGVSTAVSLLYFVTKQNSVSYIFFNRTKFEDIKFVSVDFQNVKLFE
jgi:hypothetical protein